MRPKHRNDYNHGKDGWIGGNPRFSGKRGFGGNDHRPNRLRLVVHTEPEEDTVLFKNPNCDKDKCTSITGEVRLLPTGGGGNMIVCRACYDDEIKYRKERNAESGHMPFDLPKWEDLKVYTND